MYFTRVVSPRAEEWVYKVKIALEQRGGLLSSDR
jgi:hypothetical protein